jgi:hypothetical protein
MAEMLTLARDAAVPGRPFTELGASRRDLETLARMRACVRRRVLAGSFTERWRESGDLHWLVAPRPRELAAPRRVLAVGFFGQAREGVDHGPIARLEHDLLARASSFEGLLSYHNVRFASGQWGNLVVFAGEYGPTGVRGDPTHNEAVARAGDHYHSVRIHRLRLEDGPTGTAAFGLLSTLLIDFADTPPWRAVRDPW